MEDAMEGITGGNGDVTWQILEKVWDELAYIAFVAKVLMTKTARDERASGGRRKSRRGGLEAEKLEEKTQSWASSHEGEGCTSQTLRCNAALLSLLLASLILNLCHTLGNIRKNK